MGLSGKTGVKWVARLGKWRAYIQNKHLGMFSEFDEAVASRRAAELEHFGRYSRG